MKLRRASSLLEHPALISLRSVTAVPESCVVRPPIKPWPGVLTPKGLIKLVSCHSDPDDVFRIFEYASNHQRDFTHTSQTYAVVIERLSRARVFASLDAVLARLLCARITCEEETFVSIIREYGLAGKPTLSMKTFSRMEEFRVSRSVRSLNATLNALVRNRRYDLAHTTFRDCRTRYHIIPNEATCNILLKAMCKMKNLEGAREMLDEMPAMGLVPNLVTYTTLLGGYASHGDICGAKKVFEELLDRGWTLDATTYTAFMLGYCKQGKLFEAVRVMDEMEDNGVSPNEVTYGVMIEAFCKAKKSGEANNMFDDMLERGYSPSASLCSRVLDLLCQDGKAKDASILYMKMVKNCCVTDGAMVTTIIYWLCKEGKIWDARRLLGELKNREGFYGLVYDMIIGGMCEKGEFREAGKLWDEMVEKGFHPSCATYIALITGFCRTNRAKEATGVLQEMLERGLKPEKSTWLTLINGLAEFGATEEIDEILILAVECGTVDANLVNS